MEALNVKTPPSISLLVALASSIFGSIQSAAQIKPLNYDTPTYIEVETDAIQATNGSTSVTINLSRTGEFRVLTKVDYETVDETASAGEDYKPTGGTLVFKPGEGFKTIIVELLGEATRGAAKTFQLKLWTTTPDTYISRDLVTVTVEQAAPVAVELPALNIARAENGGVKLSWAAADGLVLERSVTGEAASWESVPCQVQTSNGVSEVTENCAGRFLLYRLRRE